MNTFKYMVIGYFKVLSMETLAAAEDRLFTGSHQSTASM